MVHCMYVHRNIVLLVCRVKAKSMIANEVSAPQLPYQLDVINEDEERGVVKRRSHRERSPAMWRGSIQKPPEDSYRVPRGMIPSTNTQPLFSYHVPYNNCSR